MIFKTDISQTVLKLKRLNNWPRDDKTLENEFSVTTIENLIYEPEVSFTIFKGRSVLEGLLMATIAQSTWRPGHKSNHWKKSLWCQNDIYINIK